MKLFTNKTKDALIKLFSLGLISLATLTLLSGLNEANVANDLKDKINELTVLVQQLEDGIITCDDVLQYVDELKGELSQSEQTEEIRNALNAIETGGEQIEIAYKVAEGNPDAIVNYGYLEGGTITISLSEDLELYGDLNESVAVLNNEYKAAKANATDNLGFAAVAGVVGVSALAEHERRNGETKSSTTSMGYDKPIDPAVSAQTSIME